MNIYLAYGALYVVMCITFFTFCISKDYPKLRVFGSLFWPITVIVFFIAIITDVVVEIYCLIKNKKRNDV